VAPRSGFGQHKCIRHSSLYEVERRMKSREGERVEEQLALIRKG
jgi:hypothetical protein